MKLLAVSLNRHDSSISYFDGDKVRYLKLERLKQRKRYAIQNRWQWIYEIKNHWGIDAKDMDAIAFDFHLNSFFGVGNVPPDFQHILDGTKNYVKLQDSNNMFKEILDHDNLYYVSHHYAHSLSSWMLTDVKPNLNIVIDGEGDGKPWSVYRDDVCIERGNIEQGSIGGDYMRTAAMLGITSTHTIDNAGKLMGLQSYGTIDEDFIKIFKDFTIRDSKKIYSIDYWNNYKQDLHVAGLMPLDWVKSIHIVLNDVIIKLFKKHAKKGDVISYSGGVAQNVVWNAELKKHFPNLIIPPHSGDDGTTLGMLEFLRIKNSLPPLKLDKFPYCQDDVSPTSEPSYETIKQAARWLADGKTVGWYQGNGEVGPRALGNRSILMDPRIPDGKAQINRIKMRENYRPFGASVLAEHVSEYFDMTYEDNYMLYSTQVHDPKQFPAITHVDGSCRVQTVTDNNPAFRKLLEEFKRLTGCAVLLNTSLNMAGKPLAAYPEIALDFFEITPLDCLVVGDKLYNKQTYKQGCETSIMRKGIW